MYGLPIARGSRETYLSMGSFNGLDVIRIRILEDHFGYDRIINRHRGDLSG